MVYSSIQKKKCKCRPDCDKWPTLSCFGYNYAHLPEDLKEKAGTKNKVARKNRNKRVAIGRKLYAAQNQVRWDEYRQWFVERRKEMTGRCENCGSKTFKNDDVKFTWSVAHLLEKRHFNSISTHPDNWLELCWECHTNFDNQGASSWVKLKCWNEIERKFKILYPLITSRENQYIPDVLLKTLITDPKVRSDIKILSEAIK